MIMVLVVTLLATATAWGYTTANYSFTTTPLGTGEIGTVTYINELFYEATGSGLRAGVEIYRIDLGSATLSDKVKIHILLRALADYDKVQILLDNDPNLWIDFAVWHQDANGTHRLTDGTRVSREDGTRMRMYTIHGNVVLVPTLPNYDTLYVMASANVPPDKFPPGKQGDFQAAEVGFFGDLRTV